MTIRQFSVFIRHRMSYIVRAFYPWHRANVKSPQSLTRLPSCAQCGYNVLVQCGANQPLYDLMAVKDERKLPVSVKGSQDGGWMLAVRFVKPWVNYHAAIDRCLPFSRKTLFTCWFNFSMLHLVKLHAFTLRARRRLRITWKPNVMVAVTGRYKKTISSIILARSTATKFQANGFSQMNALTKFSPNLAVKGNCAKSRAALGRSRTKKNECMLWTMTKLLRLVCQIHSLSLVISYL